MAEGDFRVSREIKKFNHLMKVYENKVFPIPQGYEYSFENGFGAPRTFGGDRRHEGIDIMCDKGVPLVSVSDGKILKKGWNTLGGWRLFIKGDDGIYYYYAHLYRYNDDLKAGDRVSKGQLLGYVGDSGYGEEGTTGEFLPHLHFGMYEGKDEVPVNPYPFLKKWENNTVELAGTDPELKIHEVEISIN
jgi:murein DD-endopeptidase MepM/ murein hydrolase activator NlpD